MEPKSAWFKMVTKKFVTSTIGTQTPGELLVLQMGLWVTGEFVESCLSSSFSNSRISDNQEFPNEMLRPTPPGTLAAIRECQWNPICLRPCSFRSRCISYALSSVDFPNGGWFTTPAPQSYFPSRIVHAALINQSYVGTVNIVFPLSMSNCINQRTKSPRTSLLTIFLF